MTDGADGFRDVRGPPPTTQARRAARHWSRKSSKTKTLLRGASLAIVEVIAARHWSRKSSTTKALLRGAGLAIVAVTAARHLSRNY